MWKANNNESPIKTNTEKLIQKLQSKLPEYDVYSAMRYQNPSIKDTLSEILLTNPDEIIIFPSFPQYASSTTGSVYEEVFNILSKEWVIPKIKFINQFFNNDLFIDAWIEKISDFDISNYEKIILEIANSHNVKLYPLNSGLSDSGPDLGSAEIKLIHKKNVAIFSGEDNLNSVSSLKYGSIWYFFEQELKYPLTHLNVENFDDIELN